MLNLGKRALTAVFTKLLCIPTVFRMLSTLCTTYSITYLWNLFLLKYKEFSIFHTIWHDLLKMCHREFHLPLTHIVRWKNLLLSTYRLLLIALVFCFVLCNYYRILENSWIFSFTQITFGEPHLNTCTGTHTHRPICLTRWSLMYPNITQVYASSDTFYVLNAKIFCWNLSSLCFQASHSSLQTYCIIPANSICWEGGGFLKQSSLIASNRDE